MIVMHPFDWQLSNQKPVLGSNCVHVWSANLLSDSYNYEYFFDLLSHIEKDRANKYKFELDRKMFIVRRAILRIILSKYLGICPSDIDIRTSIYGKPEIVQTLIKNPIFFSLSHSQNIALYAIARNKNIGIDTEFIHTLDFDSLLLSLLPPDQAKTIILRQGDKALIFFDFWTTLEAYLKAVGTGFMQPFDHEALTNIPVGLFANGRENSNWSLTQFVPETKMIASIVIHQPTIETSFWRFSMIDAS